MTGRSSSKRTSLCLLALLLSCLSSDNLLLVVGEPEPIPSELFYSEGFINNAENLPSFVVSPVSNGRLTERFIDGSQIFLNKLKQITEERNDMEEQEKELDDMRMVLQSVLEPRTKAKMRPGDYPIEELRAPNPILNDRQHPGKRTAISYMTLCHFKICNMGRKRQLHN